MKDTNQRLFLAIALWLAVYFGYMSFIGPKKNPADPNDRLSAYTGLEMIKTDLFVRGTNVSPNSRAPVPAAMRAAARSGGICQYGCSTAKRIRPAMAGVGSLGLPTTTGMDPVSRPSCQTCSSCATQSTST